MNKFTKIAMFLVAIVAITTIPFYAMAESSHEDGDQKVSICHSTGSQSNPWDAIQISQSAWLVHQSHGDFSYAGPVKDGKPDGKDKKDDNWCSSHIPPKLTVTKTVVNVGGGTKIPNDFNLKVDNTSVLSGVAIVSTVGSHTVSETNLTNYSVGSWGGDCNVSGQVSLAFGNNKTCTITNTYNPPASQTGSIKVCKIVLDADGEVVSGLAGTTFTIPWVNASYEGPAVGVPSSAVFNTPLTLENIFGETKGQCVTYSELPVGRYYYGEEQITSGSEWDMPKYNDQANMTVSNLSDMNLYNTDLDVSYDNYDGVINVGADQTRTLIVLNKMKFVPAQGTQCEPGVELIKNGSFEAPIVSNGANWDIINDGTSGLDWAVAWMSGSGGESNPSLELHKGVNSWLSAQGIQHAELDGDWFGPSNSGAGPASTKIYEDISTVPGKHYELRFSFSPRPNTDATQNILGVLWGGADVSGTPLSATNATNQTIWTENTYNLLASANTTRIQFEDRGASDSLGTFVDNVSLKCLADESTPQNCGEGYHEEENQCVPNTPTPLSCENGFHVVADTCVADEPTTHDDSPPPPPPRTSRSGDRIHSFGGVLGASTDLPNSCSALLTTYMRLGKKNDTDEVKKLQQFLNDNLGINLPITGFFGHDTDAAVRAFQAKHNGPVLGPWKISESTGYVYKTTQRWINMLYCSTLDIPMPDLGI